LLQLQTGGSVSLTPPRYTPADYERIAEGFGCVQIHPDGETFDVTAMLRQAAGQARVLDRLRANVLERRNESMGPRATAFDEALDILSRLLREEGVT